MAARILGVSPTASTKEIKEAFKRLALIHHPDKPTGCPKKFLELQAAMEELQRRKQEPSIGWYSEETEPGGRSAEDATERRDWDERQRRWRAEHEEATSPRSMSIKWGYMRTVCMIIGLGAVLKLALFNAVGAARERALLGQAENGHMSRHAAAGPGAAGAVVGRDAACGVDGSANWLVTETVWILEIVRLHLYVVMYLDYLVRTLYLR
jgi:hypothetical protein